MDGSHLRAGHVARRRRGEADQGSFGFIALAQRAQHRLPGGFMALADVEEDASRFQHPRGDEGTVEHEVGTRRHEQPVLLASRLTLRTVDHDHGVAARSVRDGAPLDCGGKAGASATDKARLVDRIDDPAVDARQRKSIVRGCEEARHCGSRLSTAVRKVERGAASGSLEPPVSRITMATPTAATHPAVIASIQADHVSVPVPTP